MVSFSAQCMVEGIADIEWLHFNAVHLPKVGCKERLKKTYPVCDGYSLHFECQQGLFKTSAGVKLKLFFIRYSSYLVMKISQISACPDTVLLILNLELRLSRGSITTSVAFEKCKFFASFP